MHLKLISLLAFLFILLAGFTVFTVVKKNYLSYNMLRFDPLEENKINPLSGLKSADIWLIGDSRIGRWDEELLSPLSDKIVNLGIEGQTSAQVLNRLKNYLEIGKPRWVFLEVGINDIKIIGVDRKLSDALKTGCFRNITAIIELSRKNNINVLVLGIFPTGDIEPLRRLVWNSSVDSAIAQVNDKLRLYCSNNDVKYFDASKILSDNKGKVKSNFQDGFLHINNEAYKVLCSNIIKEFGSEIRIN
jgi:lysophospholipase L1-like esterase